MTWIDMQSDAKTAGVRATQRRSPEDWIAVARSCNEAGAVRSVMNPILAALCITLDRLDHPEEEDR